MMTIPNLLVLVRLMIIPVMVVSFFGGQWWTSWLTFVLFVVAALTDLVDGFLARRLNQQTLFGAVFDPIADKLLVTTVLFLLIIDQHLTGVAVVPVMIVLLRELLISGLREQLGLVGIALPVVRLAKLKALSQMLACGCLLLGVAWSVVWVSFALLGEVLLWASAVVTIGSAMPYLRAGWQATTQPAQPSPKDTS